MTILRLFPLFVGYLQQEAHHIFQRGQVGRKQGTAYDPGGPGVKVDRTPATSGIDGLVTL